MKNFKFMLSVLIVALLVSVSPAGAGMIGYTIEAKAFFPDVTGPTTGGPIVKVVGGGVEFLDGDFGAFFGPSFDFADTTITITHAATAHSAGTFNGYRFNDILGTLPGFTGFSVLSDNTGFFSGDASRLFFDADNLWINFQNLDFAANADANIVLSVTTGQTVPDAGATLLLFGMGLAGLGAFRRRRG